MRIVPTFIAISATTFLFAARAHAAPLTLQGCGLNIDLKGFVLLNQTPEAANAELNAGPQKLTLLVACSQNTRKTSAVEEIRAMIAARGDTIKGFSETELPGGKTLIYRKTSQIKNITTMEAYFASREFEFRFIVLPVNSSSLHQADWTTIEQMLVSVLSTVKLENQTRAITESEYKMRLTLAAGGIAIVMSVCVFLLIRSFRKKKRAAL